MRAFTRRNQLVLFLALTFIISWIPWYLGGDGFFTWGVSAAGLIVVAVADGKQGLRVMTRRLGRWRASPMLWAVAVLVPVAMVIVAIGIHALSGGETPPFTLWKEEWYLTPVLALILLTPFGGPGGEEYFGWRGYAQAKLLERWGQWSPLIASVVIGTAWGVWHLPEFFNPLSTQYALGMAFFVPFIVTEIAASIVITWLYIKTGGSVLIAGVVYHLMIDMSSTALIDFTVTGMLDGDVVPPADARLIAIIFAVQSMVALSLVVATRGRLGYAGPVEAEERRPAGAPARS